MSDINIGTVSASVRLNLQQLRADVEQAKTWMGELGVALQASNQELAGVSAGQKTAILQQPGGGVGANIGSLLAGAAADPAPPGNPKETLTGSAQDLARTLQEIVRQAMGGMDSIGEEAAAKLEPLRRVAESLDQIFTDAFQALFDHGPKRFFQEVLDGFKQMLERMVAEWLAKTAVMGIAQLIGGPIGGALSGIFGFDDGDNDRTARHWGFDFAGQFSNGFNDYVAQRHPLPHVGGERSSGNQTIHVHMDNIHLHDTTDYAAAADTLAWHIQQKLRVRVGS